MNSERLQGSCIVKGNWKPLSSRVRVIAEVNAILVVLPLHLSFAMLFPTPLPVSIAENAKKLPNNRSVERESPLFQKPKALWLYVLVCKLKISGPITSSCRWLFLVL